MISDHIRNKAGALRALAARLVSPDARTVTRTSVSCELCALAGHLDELAEDAAAIEEGAFAGPPQRLAAAANREALRRAMSMAGVLRHPVLPEGVADLESWRRQRDEGSAPR